jgi:multiple sugar transport system permease protein
MRKNREGLAAILFFTPFGILFLLFTIVPVVVAVVLSFTNYSVLQSPILVGINNYKYLFTQDNLFIVALKNTLSFALFSGPIGYVVSFLVAWIIDSLRFKKFFSLAFYAPSITSGIAMSVVWLYFFSPDRYGFINNFLLQNGFIDTPILWTQDPSKVLVIVIIVSVWMGMGNGFLAFLAGFQNMSTQVYEAGRIDGIRNKFQELIYITIPMMKPMLLFGAINTIAGSFGVYEIPMTLAGTPGPENSALTLVGHLNDYAFTRMDLGYASAVAVVLFAMTFIIGRVIFKALGSKDE